MPAGGGGGSRTQIMVGGGGIIRAWEVHILQLTFFG